MKTVGCQPASHQRGIVSVLLVIIMVTVVAFVLVQTLVISGSTSSDDSRQLGRVGSLTLAESGLQGAAATLIASVNGTGNGTDGFDSSTNCCIAGSSCSGGLPSGSLVLGGSDKFEYVSVTTLPDGCISGCYGCKVTARGKSGETTRTVQSIFKMSSMSFCKAGTDKDCSNQKAPPPVWWLTLPGLTTPPAGIGVFNLAAAGNVGCWSGGCLAAGDLRWQLSDGSKIFGLGNTVPQTTAETSVYQKLSANTDVAQTGALFQGVNGKAPTVVGAYSDINTTKGNGTTGSTTDGASPESAASWCYRDGSIPAGDTLILGYSAHASGTGATGQLKENEVSFNTIPLDDIAKSPHPTNKAAANTVSSELWYKHNPAYSYGTRIRGEITSDGIIDPVFQVNFNKKTPYDFCVTSGWDTVGKYLKVGDTIEQTFEFGVGKIAKITNILPNKCFEIDLAPQSSGNRTVTATIHFTARLLKVNQIIGGSDIITNDSVVGSALVNGTRIVIPSGTQILQQLTGSSGREGTYLLSNASSSELPETAMVIGGATSSGTTVTVTKGPLPTRGTIVQTRLGNALGKGQFAPNTKVDQIISATTFTVKNDDPNVTPILTPLAGAEICGGTCALFDHSTTTTGFRLATSALPSGTDSWVAGFTCLDSAGEKPTSLNAAISMGRTWSEVAQ